MRTLVNRVWPKSLLLALAAAAYGGTVYVNDGLPTGGNAANFNAGSASRSNVDWINSGGFVNGDSFVLPGSSTYIVDSISVFIVLNKPGDTFINEFSGATLYGGVDCGDGNPCPGFGSVSTSGTLQSVTVSGAGNACTSYLSLTGACLPIVEVTFNTNITLTGGTVYDFAADGTLQGGLTGCDGPCGWYNLALNGSLAGWGAGTFDNKYLNWDGTAITGGYLSINSAPGCAGAAADICGGWDKSSDMAVIVTANLSTVPEPASVTLSGLGIAGLALAAYRRRKALRKSDV